jgi:two-component system, OmpR family, phosphate regulon sensor histidine kinase PhoR
MPGISRERSVDAITPRQVSLAAASFTGILTGALCIITLRIVLPDVQAWWGLVAGAVSFAAAYATVLVVIERYIRARLEVLFRLVHDLRSQGGVNSEVDMDGDVIGKVRSAMVEWAQEERSEIRALKDREKYRREFIGNLAHELKTPIFNMQGYVLTLLDGGLEDERVNRDFLQRASRSTDRLIQIVEDLDMISQLESGVISMTQKTLDLSELVEGSMKEAEQRAAAKGINLRSEVKDGTMVRGDKGRLEQVFANLLNNAIQYGLPGGLVIVRAIAMDQDRWLVEVSDNGIGIAEEHLPRLFERFYRVGSSRSRNEGGSGLGLAIVKHIIEAHDGTISVKSTEGEGTTFSFTLQRPR